MNVSLRRLAFLFALSVSVAYVHVNGIERSWYWEYPWLDLPMHFFGGMAVGLLVQWGSERAWGVRLPFLTHVLIVLFVGIIWEVFEYVAGIIDVSRDAYIEDTMIDLVLDICGGSVVVFSRAKYGRAE